MKKGIVLLIALLSACYVSAQRKPNVGFGLQIGNPEGTYETTYGGTPVGLSINGSFPLSRWSPLEIGFDLGTNSMGSRSLNMPVFDEFGNYFHDGEISIRSSYNVAHVQARFKPFNGRVKPYADALIGMKSHKTTMDVDVSNGFEMIDLDRDVVHRDVTESFGFGIGLQAVIAPHINLDIKYQHLRGGTTSMVDPGSFQVFDNEAYTFDIKNTPESNLDVITVGISFDF
jgi:opacity protein-like surface antigen